MHTTADRTPPVLSLSKTILKDSTSTWFRATCESIHLRGGLLCVCRLLGLATLRQVPTHILAKKKLDSLILQTFQHPQCLHWLCKKIYHSGHYVFSGVIWDVAHLKLKSSFEVVQVSAKLVHESSPKAEARSKTVAVLPGVAFSTIAMAE